MSRSNRASPSLRLRRFVAELRRRRVFRVAAVYGAVAFLVAQVADIAFPALHLPGWTVTLVVVLALLGFPVALVLAWAFELTPDGVVRTSAGAMQDASPTAAPAGTTGPAYADHEAPPGPVATPTRAPWPMQRVASVGGLVVLAAAGGAFMVFGDRPASGPEAVEVGRSIAVLPFEDLSPERDHGWFSDGVTEDIQTQLSRIANLKVIGRTSVARYADRGSSTREIGQELGVATVLEGSVRRVGERVRVTAKLVEAATDRQLWAESYDRELTDIFRIQGELAGQIAEALQARFSAEQREHLGSAPTTSLTAYDLSLQARMHAHRLTRSDLDRAIQLYRQVLELDPDYARAHAELAYAFVALEGYHGAGAHWLDTAMVSARRAVALEPDGPEGLAALALVQWNSGQLDEAIDGYHRALAIRPNDAMSLWGLSFAHWLRGNLDEALRQARRSVELDPAAPGLTTLLARCHVSLGDIATGEALLRQTLELQPDFPWAHQDLLWVYIWTGRFAEAEAQLETATALFPGAPEILNITGLLRLRQGDYRTARAYYDRVLNDHPGWALSPLAEAGFVHARMGATERARELLRLGREHGERSLLRGSDNDHWWRAGLARIAAQQGDPDEAMHHLEVAYDGGWRGYPMMDLGDDPILEPLHEDPRFQRLRRAMMDDIARMR